MEVTLWRLLVLQGSLWFPNALAHSPKHPSGPGLVEFLSFTHRASLVSNGDGFVAWVETKRGVANVVAAVFSDGGWREEPLTRFTEDDGNFIGNVAHHQGDERACSSGRCGFLTFARGTDSAVNPRHKVVPPPQEFWVLDLTADEVSARQIDVQPVLAISPCGQLAVSSGSYAVGTSGAGRADLAASGAVLFFVNLTSSARSEVLKTKQGRIEEAAWSPTGDRLAFVNNRGDHSFIGIYALHRPQAVRWVAPSVDSDGFVAWSPDGAKIAFLRFRDRTSPSDVRADPDLHTAPAFSVMVADVSDDKKSAAPAVEVFRDWIYGYPDDKAGYGNRPLLFFNTSMLVFGVEDQGFIEPVFVDLFTRAVHRPLAAGKHRCEAANWQLAPATAPYAAGLIVTSNCFGNTLETLSLSLVRPHADGFLHEPLVVGNSSWIVGLTESGSGAQVATPQGHLAYLAFAGERSTELRLRSAAGEDVVLAPGTPLPTIPGTAPATKVSAVMLPSSDGLFNLSGQIFEPTDKTRRSGIGLLFTHGGSQRQMYSAYHYSLVYAQYYAFNHYLASTGAVVLSVNYRSGSGHGRAFRVCERCGMWGAAEYLDVLAAGRSLAAQARSVGLFGLSYGGLNTLQGLARNSDVFLAGVASAPVFSWPSQMRYDGEGAMFDLGGPQWHNGFRSLPYGPPSWLAGPQWQEHVQRNLQIAFDSSPAGHIETFRSPVLLIHGDSDQEVAFQEGVGLVRALRQGGRAEVETLIFPDESHGLCVFEHQLEAFAATEDFFRRRLGGAAADAPPLLADHTPLLQFI